MPPFLLLQTWEHDCCHRQRQNRDAGEPTCPQIWIRTEKEEKTTYIEKFSFLGQFFELFFLVATLTSKTTELLRKLQLSSGKTVCFLDLATLKGREEHKQGKGKGKNADRSANQTVRVSAR
jgi:hypothetical protein